MVLLDCVINVISNSKLDFTRHFVFCIFTPLKNSNKLQVTGLNEPPVGVRIQIFTEINNIFIL